MSGAATMTPFGSVLIANRGEIALRILRTARRLGHRVITVYSEADAGARHVREADLALPIGGALPAESYLRGEAIIAAAKACGAEAIHPGYGFLAENAGFAEAVRAAGLAFIGPSAAAIRAMGDKAGAKAVMAAAGVPCVPGFQGDQDEAVLAREAARIGFPVMIKASAGGGGRGMRLVTAPEAFAEALRGARSEAEGAFGDGTVLLERALLAPRHIEIQVFGDRHGHAVHLGERDCSVQRRHQKVIEEAPSPAVGPELRARMGEVAVRAVQAIGYEGAGTLEFLLDRGGQFYFMEMNTRLQVEHPVTEAITGLDLVEWQLRVAAGEPLPLRQDEIRFRGHAIEVRLCAEDPARDFMPQAGTLQRWRMPPDLRVDHALADGSVIPAFYDSMLAKLVAHGGSRDEARRRLRHGLDAALAFGVPTNRGFLAACLAHPVFAAGEATTAFIGAHRDSLLAAPALPWPAPALAAFALYVTGGAAPRPGRALTAEFALPMRLALGEAVHAMEVLRRRDGDYLVRLDGAGHLFELERRDEGELAFRAGGRQARLAVLRDGDRLFLQLDGVELTVRDLTYALPDRAGQGGGDGRLRAAMTGRVVAVSVSAGETVSAGQPLVTLEAMKMEHVHVAPVAGVVRAVHVDAGAQVSAGHVVAEIEPAALAAE
jgi:geranyl-CoA carboxylase alpha subunit